MICGYFERKRCEKDVKLIQALLEQGVARINELEALLEDKEARIESLKEVIRSFRYVQSYKVQRITRCPSCGSTPEQPHGMGCTFPKDI